MAPAIEDTMWALKHVPVLYIKLNVDISFARNLSFTFTYATFLEEQNLPRCNALHPFFKRSGHTLLLWNKPVEDRVSLSGCGPTDCANPLPVSLESRIWHPGHQDSMRFLLPDISVGWGSSMKGGLIMQLEQLHRAQELCMQESRTQTPEQGTMSWLCGIGVESGYN